MSKTLGDWLPCYDENLEPYKKLKVVEQYGCGHKEKPHPFSHKYVFNWCVLENGWAVGWNENPSRGWNFPVKKRYKK